ncbi:MAG: hypothetical protein KKB51_15985, partial [Candidatus Riflebacteria bacterium]|nr:hypothetical protein [Candidatus Riflebacteria bacterium]
GLFVDRANIILSGKNIGTVSVFVTPRLVEEYLRNFLLFIVVSIIALNICLVFVIFQLLSRTVIKPLKAIESYALKVGAGDHEEALIQGDRFFGELENLRCSILLMTQSLSEAQQELIRKEKLSVIGQLSGIVAHEIRNPLGVMNNAVYLLNTLMPNADDNVKKYLDMIKHEIDNSQRIVSDLLDFARTKTPQISPIAPGTLVTQSLGKSHIPENVSVKTNISETLPELLVDPFQMGQVLRNLFTNAIQAMPGGGTLTIATQRVSSSGLEPSSLQSATCNLQQDFVEILVKDTGEGITPENMKKLFQPLFTTKAKGVGLGLLVCENLVKANGGRIEVKSTVGIGTTFTIKFPISERI